MPTAVNALCKNQVRVVTILFDYLQKTGEYLGWQYFGSLVVYA